MSGTWVAIASIFAASSFSGASRNVSQGVGLVQLIESSPCVTFAEGKLLDLDGFSLISMGWTNPTPWDTFREAPENELAAKIEAIATQVPDMSRAIFNFHAPPYGTGLDEAPALDANLRPVLGGAVMKPVGSTAVRDAAGN